MRQTYGLEAPHSPGNVGGYIDGNGEAWATPLNVVSSAETAQTAFRRAEIKQMNIAGAPSFQQSTISA